MTLKAIDNTNRILLTNNDNVYLLQIDNYRNNVNSKWFINIFKSYEYFLICFNIFCIYLIYCTFIAIIDFFYVWRVQIYLLLYFK
jgi:hypothetical protein